MNSDTSLAEKLRTLFKEQGITLAAIFTAISMIISAIVVSLTGGAGGGSGGGAPPKDKNKLMGWFKDKLKGLSDAIKRLAAKTVAALSAIIGSVFGAVLNFLAKAVLNFLALLIIFLYLMRAYHITMYIGSTKASSSNIYFASSILMTNQTKIIKI